MCVREKEGESQESLTVHSCVGVGVGAWVNGTLLWGGNDE